MRSLYAIVAALGLALMPASASTLLVDNFWHGAWILPSAGGTKPYGASDRNATWTIGQYSNPGADMSSFAAVSCGVSAYSACAVAWADKVWARLYTLNGTPHAVLGEVGRNMPCYVSGPTRGYELDNFISANNALNFPRYPAAVLAHANV